MILQKIISGSGMILAGILFLFIFKIRKSIAFKYILYGGIVWAGTIALKFTCALLLNKHIYGFLYSALPAKVADPLFWVYVGLLTGIFECGGIYLVIKLTKLKNISKWESYAFGYGFGSTEAILIGLAQLLSIIAIFTGQIPVMQIDWLVIPAPIVERVMAIFLHLFTTLLIIYGIKENKPSLFWISLLYKSLVDAIAAWAQLSFGITSTSHIWLVEGIFFIVTSFSIVGSILFCRRGETQNLAEGNNASSFSS